MRTFLRGAAVLLTAGALLASCSTMHKTQSRQELRSDSTGKVTYDSSGHSRIQELQVHKVDSSKSSTSSESKTGQIKISLDPSITGRAVYWDAKTKKLRRYQGGKWTDADSLATPGKDPPPLEVEITPVNGKDYTNGIRIRAPGNTTGIEIDGQDLSEQSHLQNFEDSELHQLQRDDSAQKKGSDSSHVKKEVKIQSQDKTVKGISPLVKISALVGILLVLLFFIARRYFTGGFL